jgi:hypothetical protein
MIFMWLAHWHLSINALCSPCGVERTEGSSYCLLLLLTKIDGHNSKSKYTIVSLRIPSSLRPVEHDDSLPILKPPQQLTLNEEELTSTSPEDKLGLSCSIVDPDFVE